MNKLTYDGKEYSYSVLIFDRSDMIQVKFQTECPPRRSSRSHTLDVMLPNGVRLKSRARVSSSCGDEKKATFKFMRKVEITDDLAAPKLKKPVRKNIELSSRRANKLKPGDYVLATKWPDGMGDDPWTVGFLTFIEQTGDRAHIKVSLDPSGESPIRRRFRKAVSITKEEGRHLLDKRDDIERGETDLYKYLETIRKGDINA